MDGRSRVWKGSPDSGHGRIRSAVHLGSKIPAVRVGKNQHIFPNRSSPGGHGRPSRYPSPSPAGAHAHGRGHDLERHSLRLDRYYRSKVERKSDREIKRRAEPAEQVTEGAPNSNVPCSLNQQQHNRNHDWIDIAEIVVPGIWIVEADGENRKDRHGDDNQQRQPLTSRPAHATRDTDPEKNNKR